MAVSLSWEEAVVICDLICETSYEIPVIILNEFENKSDIKGYHAYKNSWKTIIWGNIQTCQEPDTIMDKYPVAVLKDTQVVCYLTKWKSTRYDKAVFYFLRAN